MRSLDGPETMSHSDDLNEATVTTGEAAKICSVTPNTVLRWIREGKLRAERTAGGHHRIPRGVLSAFLASRSSSCPTERSEKSLRYCWEFHSVDGIVKEVCLRCVIYRSRSGRCYELVKLPAASGHGKIHCVNSCEDCEYFEIVSRHRPKVLIVSGSKHIHNESARHLKEIAERVCFAENEYQCSKAIDSFRPDYVIIDFRFGGERCKELAKSIRNDPRMPFARLIFIGRRKQFPEECEHLAYAFVSGPTGAEALAAIVRQL